MFDHSYRRDIFAEFFIDHFIELLNGVAIIRKLYKPNCKM